MNSEEPVSILLVDDRPENLLALEAVLERLGEHCVKANSGTEALRYVLHQEFAVILLDAQMPEMDGFETATLIRQREKSADIPIIFLTAIDKSLAQVFRGYAAGAVDYVFKPFDPEVLRSKVRVFINLFKKTRDLQKQAEQLRESEERYALAVEGASDGIWDWDIRTDTIHYSPRWKEMLGYAPEEIGTSSVEWFKRVLQEDMEQLQSTLNAHLDGKTDHFESEFRMSHRDGGIRWILCRGLAVRNPGGLVYRMAGSMSDVTRRKMAEEELVSRERLATIGLTISNAAHSMKNVLQGVNGGFYFIEKHVAESGSTTLIEPFKIFKSSIGRLNQLVMDMLDYSKERTAVKERIVCEKLFEEVREILTIPAEAHHVRLEFQTEPSAGMFYNDSERLFRALVNLGTNAIDAIKRPRGVITFSAAIKKSSELPLNEAALPADASNQTEDALVLEVRDTGTGIPREIRDKLFEPFFSTKASKGTGLGLASIKEFVKEQKGAILLESTRGRGTSFKLVFFDPLCAPPSE